MGRLEIEVGIYTEDFTRILSWFYKAWKEEEPPAADVKLFNKMKVYEEDMKRQDKEADD